MKVIRRRDGKIIYFKTLLGLLLAGAVLRHLLHYNREKQKRKKLDMIYDLIDQRVETEEEAQRILFRVYTIFKEVPVETFYKDYSLYFGHCSYLWFLMPVRRCIEKKCYIQAKYELETIFHHEKRNICQPRIWYNILDTLSTIQEDINVLL